jgi:hypothetical protein
MRSVRCDVCGTKALTAASQCPKCAHLFEVRNWSGELLPLAYCSSCDSYYPERVGLCRWCGTKPEPAPKSPRLLKGLGVAVVAGLVITTWVLRDSRPAQTPVVRPQAERQAEPLAERPVATVSADTAVSHAPVAPTDTVRMADVALPMVASAEVATAPTPSPARWVRSIAKDWVIVRAGPNRRARILASIGPSSRVQLGDTVGMWRQLKTRGVAGWVEPGSLFDTAPTSTRRRVVVSP